MEGTRSRPLLRGRGKQPSGCSYLAGRTSAIEERSCRLLLASDKNTFGQKIFIGSAPERNVGSLPVKIDIGAMVVPKLPVKAPTSLPELVHGRRSDEATEGPGEDCKTSCLNIFSNLP